MNAELARTLMKEADLIIPEAEIHVAIERLAGEISSTLADEHPLLLAVMGGAVFFAGQLLPKLRFPLEFDYIHATRYGRETSGGTIAWLVEPGENVRGRTVLVLDDILDGGQTLAEIRARILQQGARAFYSAVLTEKMTGIQKPFSADFVGVNVPDRFVFGCGMDCHGAWRNLPAIYAVREKT
jgi:hypoxanthine phosphoribosyltransferase